MRESLIRLLRWSERYTKTDMVYLASGAFWSIFGQISASFIALGLAIVMARYVPKDVYGSYKYILAIVSILATLSLSGIGSAVFQSVAHGYRSALADGFKANLRWSGLVFLGAFAGGAYYLLQGNPTLGIGILLGGCITPFLSGFNLYLSLLTGERDFRSAAWYGDFVTNIVPAITLALVAYFTPQPLLLLSAYFLANAVASAYAFIRTRARFPDREKKHDPGMLTYGKHLSAMNILSGMAANIDQVLLFHFVGPVELAIYNFAIAIPDQAKGPLKMFDSMIQARFASRTDAQIRHSMVNKLLWLGTFYAIATFAYILVAPTVYGILFPKYTDATFYSQIYALSILIFPLGIANSYFSIRKKVREQYIVTIVASVFQIGAMLVGVLLWGLMGLVIARVLSRYFTSTSSYILYAASSANRSLS